MDEMNHIDYLPYKTKHTKQPHTTSTPPPATAFGDELEHGRYDGFVSIIDDQSSPVLDNKHDEPIYIKEWSPKQKQNHIDTLVHVQVLWLVTKARTRQFRSATITTPLVGQTEASSSPPSPP